MHTVTMYTTAVCPYCIRAKSILKGVGVTEIKEIRVDTDSASRDEMIRKTGRRTVPQIFFGDMHVGGADDLVVLQSQGVLKERLGL